MESKKSFSAAAWIALACLVVPMFASYFFDDMFSSISYLFEDPSLTALGWDAAGYGLYASGYSVLCVFGGLVVCGILLDKWGVRVTGSLFVGMMVLGAGLVLYALLCGASYSLKLAYAGCMLFGLGSEIAGTAVTRSIAKWFKDGPMALAMGLQLAIARLGTAFALVLSPKLVSEQAGHVYTLAETARPALVGMGLMALGLILWAIFVALDARFDRSTRFDRSALQPLHPDTSSSDSFSDSSSDSSSAGAVSSSSSAGAVSSSSDSAGADSSLAVGSASSSAAGTGEADDETFRLADVGRVLTNRNFWLLALLCVLFYSSIIAFKKFAGAILVPRFDMNPAAAGWMVSMLPFATVIFAPLFGMLVDKKGRGTRWMILGSILALIAHLLLAFAPAGVPLYGYLSMVFLGFGYSLVPAALWPSVPKIVPAKVLGTTFALIYWVQNLGLLSFKMLAGFILGSTSAGAAADSVAGAAASAAAVGSAAGAGSVSGAADVACAALSGPVRVELMFVGLCIAAIAVAFIFARTSDRHPDLALDRPSLR
ncbi:MAG: MFS transporter [Bacteroidales bacterium]|nr:MFS transporter [Bacteroidales bacterium]